MLSYLFSRFQPHKGNFNLALQMQITSTVGMLPSVCSLMHVSTCDHFLNYSCCLSGAFNVEFSSEKPQITGAMLMSGHLMCAQLLFEACRSKNFKTSNKHQPGSYYDLFSFICHWTWLVASRKRQLFYRLLVI